MPELKCSAAMLRRSFLDYFQNAGHTIVASSSLVPAGDATLLFTNAGMVQFKDAFLGKEKRAYTRATTCQKCMRVSGKHNDLENVGYTARHHTFFEMLGNFSFGDYFKEQAIFYAWDFLTRVLKIAPEKLWVTVHEKDDEAEKIWQQVWQKTGTKAQGLSRCGDKDNFWQMGDVGPCGPCSEIFFDHGAAIAGDIPGGKIDGDRYVEIWNLVFMQYERDASGKLTPLPKPSVDTGMGLERLAAVMQGVHDNYDNDIFRTLIVAAVDSWHLPENLSAENKISLRVIADHIRAISFLIADGITPSNEGRGYVLRRIMRRALRHLHKLPLTTEASLAHLVMPLADLMADAYPELGKQRTQIEKIIGFEEKSFNTTLEQGLKIFREEQNSFKGKVISGALAFKLYDTYGFPLDLTEDLARELKMSVDVKGFDIEMQKQRERGQKASKFAVGTDALDLSGLAATNFVGYEALQAKSKVIAIFKGQEQVPYINSGDVATVVLDMTPFYAESGGQAGDVGELTFEQGHFLIADTQKQGAVFLHHGDLKVGLLKVGAEVLAEVSAARDDTKRNHTATHLLHASLRQVLGEHVMQKGSSVDSERLRFDFAHVAPLTVDELVKIEQHVNENICADLEVQTAQKSLEEAKKSGAMALFDEKYGDKVRVITIGGGNDHVSQELCGGTHVTRTGEIGLFRIVSQEAIASGVRRIEAVTGMKAFLWQRAEEKKWQQEIVQLQHEKRELEKKLEKVELEIVKNRSSELLDKVQTVNGTRFLIAKFDNYDVKALRATIDAIKDKLAPVVIMLFSVKDGKVHFIVSVSKELSAKIKANEIVAKLALELKGSGGGKPELAQGGGSDVAALERVLAEGAGLLL